MKSQLTSIAAILAAVALGACGQRTSSSTASSSVLADTVATASADTGTMLCAPSQAQVDACAGLAAGAACSLTSTDGQVSVAGTCRETLDGLSLACGHNPPAPPAPLVDACTGKAAGAGCTVAEPDGDSHAGTCVTARDGSTLVCGRPHAPPQVAVDACSGKAAGDACTMPGLASATVDGTCSTGPAGSGVLACTPAQSLRPSATTACDGKAAGDACTLGGMHHQVAGSCVTPSAGGAPVCQAACAAFGGPFRYGHEGMGPGGPGPMPPQAVTACATLAAGDACTLAMTAGMMSVSLDGTCRAAPDAAGTLVCAPDMSPAPVPPTTPKRAIDACTGLTAGATCTVTRLDGSTGTGTCRNAPDGSGVLACVPSMMGPGPMMGGH